jgi:enoyl-CoA hydratase
VSAGCTGRLALRASATKISNQTNRAEHDLTTALTYSLHDGIATVVIDDGKANVMSVSMLRAVDGALDRAVTDKAAVVLRGRAGMFSGGFDLTAFKREPQELFEMLRAGAELTARLLAFPHPVVAVCTGHAIAMGAFVLLSTDLRIGTSRDARIQVNEVQIGMSLPHFAIEVCRQRLSPAHFNLAALTATPYNQQQAVAAGFLDEVVAPDTLPEVLKSRTDHLRGLNMEAFTATKLRLRGPGLASLRQAIDKDVEEWSTRFRGAA